MSTFIEIQPEGPTYWTHAEPEKQGITTLNSGSSSGPVQVSGNGTESIEFQFIASGVSVTR